MGSAAQAPRPASLAGKGGQAGACHHARGCVVTNRPTRCSRALAGCNHSFVFDFSASKRCLMASTKPAANARITINRIVSTPMPHAPRTCSNCDIRTGKSPSNVIGQKYSPSVAKISQGRLSNRSQSDASGKTGEPRCSRWPGLPVAALHCFLFVGAFHSPEAPLTEITQNRQRRFLGSSDGPYSAVEQPH